MKKYNSLEELNTDRIELEKKFDNGLPSYLVDFFDEKEKQLNIKDTISNMIDEGASDKEVADFRYSLRKKLTPAERDLESSDVKPIKNIDSSEQALSLEELEILKEVCEHDIYAFAVRYFSHYLKRRSSKLHRYLYKLINRKIVAKRKDKSFKIAIAAPRNNAKCLHKDTLIQLLNGSLIKVKDVNIGDKIVSINSNLKNDDDVIVAKTYSGKRLVRDFKLRSGRKISMTDDHRLFDINGEISGKNIKVGTKLSTPRIINCNTEEDTLTKYDAIFMANMLAEGCTVKSGKTSCVSRYTNFDKEVVEEFKYACVKLGFTISESSQKGTYNIQKTIPYLKKYNMARKNFATKRIPIEVFNQSDEFIKIFITRFIVTDGWVSKYNPCFGITLANEYIIDQLFTLLLRIGFQPIKQYKPNNKSNAWAVVIGGVDQLKKLAKIGILHKQDKLEETIKKYSVNKSKPNIDTIDKSWKKYLKNTTVHFLRKNHNIRVDNQCHTSREKVSKVADIDSNKFLKNLAESDIYWDEVIDISDYYKAETYDIETKKYHNFIANNIVSHNSSIISLIFPLWCICYNKKKFIVMLSDTGSKAERFLEDVKRELLHNEKMMRDFPDVVGKGSMWRVNEIITNNDIKILATGTGSNIRGERFGIYRPDLVIGDDIENSDMVRSKTMRENIRNDWFNKDVLYIGGESGTQTDFFIIGTILGKDSLLNALLDPEQYPTWESRRFSALIKEPDNLELWHKWEKIYKDRLNSNRMEDALTFFQDNIEDMIQGAEVLWPEGDPLYNLMVEKISDPSGFNSEKQNNPIDPSKVLVLMEDLTFVDFRYGFVHEALSNGKVDYFAALDPSLGKGKDSDYSCIVTIARDRKTGYLFVVDIDIKRRSPDKQIEALFKKYKIYMHKNIGIETNAFQIVLADNVRKKSREDGLYLPITDIQNYSDKHMRIQSLEPLLKDGTIVFDKFLYGNNQSYNNGIDMLCSYSEGASHDDFPDALEQAVRLCRERKFKLVVKRNS